jgi:ParB family transcriptional regulator, chromosome partitioning protein
MKARTMTMSDGGTKKRLGRGLAALIGEMDSYDNAVMNESDPKGDLSPEPEIRPDRKLPIEQIRANPYNPRRYFSEENLSDLAASIKEHGIVQPILVRPIKDEDLGGARFEIIAGERRWRAAQKAALHEVPVLIRDVADREALELAIIENVQRSDLNAVEEAQGYQQLIDEYDYTQADLGTVIGKSRSHVANTLRLLKLPESVRGFVAEGALSAGHARALVTSANPEKLAKQIIEEGLSVRQAEDLAGRQDENVDANSGSGGKTNKLGKSADTRALEQSIEQALGIAIDIRHKDNGKGEIRLKYLSLDQLEALCERLRGTSA